MLRAPAALNRFSRGRYVNFLAIIAHNIIINYHQLGVRAHDSNYYLHIYMRARARSVINND